MITYTCPHCKTKMGSITSDIGEERLGFHALTPEERSDIISYNPNGDIEVSIVCDYCHEALAANPELVMLTNPLQ